MLMPLIAWWLGAVLAGLGVGWRQEDGLHMHLPPACSVCVSEQAGSPLDAPCCSPPAGPQHFPPAASAHTRSCRSLEVAQRSTAALASIQNLANRQREAQESLQATVASQLRAIQQRINSGQVTAQEALHTYKRTRRSNAVSRRRGYLSTRTVNRLNTAVGQGQRLAAPPDHLLAQAEPAACMP